MKRTNPAQLAVSLACVGAVLAGLGLAKGGLYGDRYDGDVMHLVEIVLRIARGELPHLDFMTPLGILATWPIAVFVEAGAGIGMAMQLSQAAVVAVLLLPLLWTAWTRFPGGLAYLYGALVLIVVSALTFGGSEPSITMSMHYNRWAWALAFIALPLALVEPSGTRRESVDGVLIGLALTATAMIKVTYLAALAPGIVVALLARGAARTLVAAVLTGLAGLAVLTLLLGPGYWGAYLGDLIAVSHSDLRAYPGRSFDKVLTAPLFLGGNLLGLLAIVLLRQAGRGAMGLALLFLVPGLIYVSYQNFGNDPLWLALLGLVLLATPPDPGTTNGWGWDMRAAQRLTAVAMLGVISPSVLNLGYSQFRHFSEATDSYTQVFPRAVRNGDFFTESARAFQVNMQIAGESVGGGLEAYAERAERDEPAMLNGEALPVCTLENGMVAWFDTVARDLEKAGLADGNRILTADLLSSLWMFSDELEPLRGGAPWRYGGVPGLADATHVLVPLCAINRAARADILKQIDEAGITLTEVRRTPLYVLLRKGA